MKLERSSSLADFKWLLRQRQKKTMLASPFARFIFILEWRPTVIGRLSKNGNGEPRLAGGKRQKWGAAIGRLSEDANGEPWLAREKWKWVEEIREEQPVSQSLRTTVSCYAPGLIAQYWCSCYHAPIKVMFLLVLFMPFQHNKPHT